MNTLERAEVVQELSRLGARVRALADQVNAAQLLEDDCRDELLAAGSRCGQVRAEKQAAMLLCGQALLEARALCPHGEWREWLRRQGFSKSGAHRCMMLARPNVPRLGRLGDAVRFTYRKLARWAQRVPEVEVVLALPIEDLKRALPGLEPTERLCVAIRTRLGVANPNSTPPGKESFADELREASQVTGVDLREK